MVLDLIGDTSPYYIRCIKPNDDNVCDVFDRIRVNQQIKYIYGPVVNNKPVTCVCLPGVDVNNIIKRNNNNNHILLYKDEQHINQSIFIKLKNNPV